MAELQPRAEPRPGRGLPPVLDEERPDGEAKEPAAPERVAAQREAAPGYYGRPVLRAPVWTWQIPLYFFVGGAAGGAAVIALAGVLTGAAYELVLWALMTAMAGVVLGPLLLIWDLKRPKRFLYMLRVFKPSSPMSMGAWILTAFGGATTAATLLYALLPVLEGAWPATLLSVLVVGTVGASAMTGALLSSYTGVLVGGTAIPVWRHHHLALPLHFGAAGIGSGAALLLLYGFEAAALVGLGVTAAAVETALGLAREVRARPPVDTPTTEGRSGLALRGGTLLTGPVALVLWIGGLSVVAAVAFLLGALLSRYGWLWAGRASADDPRAALVQ